MNTRADAEATVARLIAASGLPAAEARALLAALLPASRESLIASPGREVDAETAARFAANATRRRDGVPLAYLLGEKEFYGRSFEVTPDVLVPRPDTELLIDAARRALSEFVQRLPSNAGSVVTPRVLDLGTGSGCIAITIALEVPHARVTATDASTAALMVAERNARRLHARVAFDRADWFTGAGHAITGAFDLVVSNPPYVAEGDPHLPELRHEPRGALVAGPDGLDALREIVGAAPRHLAPSGTLLVEHGYDQGEAVRALFAAAGFEAVETLRDAAGRERACIGRLV